MQLSQDIQYYDVKDIIDRTYAQREQVRQKIAECKQRRTARKQFELRRDYALYRMYQQQMQAMTDRYMEQIAGSYPGKSFFTGDAGV